MPQVTIVRFKGTQQVSEESVELKTFSKQAVLEHAGIPERLLMENDPQEEDDAVDLLVTNLGRITYASIIQHSKDLDIKYYGSSQDWEG